MFRRYVLLLKFIYIDKFTLSTLILLLSEISLLFASVFESKLFPSNIVFILNVYNDPN